MRLSLATLLRSTVPSWARSLPSIVLLGLLLGPAHGQDVARSFSWSMENDTHGALTDTEGPFSQDWISLTGGGVRYRQVPSWTGDPTYEVYFHPYFSGHPALPERLLLQVPADFLTRPLGQRAAVVGFHSYSVSEKDIFLNSDLPFECQRRGWMLIAPYGLTDLSFGNKASQEALDQVLLTIYRQLPFNHRRLYTVGFSMGGISALSYAMRHQDPLGPRVAGVVFHSGPLDMIQVHARGSLKVRMILEHPLIFGGTPQDDPFAYTRVSPVRFQRGGTVDPGHAPVLHLEDVPIYVHTNLADPAADMVQDLIELEDFLVMQGARVTQSLVFDSTGGHSWTTMDMVTALDSVSGTVLGGVPDHQRVYADRVATYGAVAVEDLPWETHGRFEWHKSPRNGAVDFSIDSSIDVNQLRVVSSMAGLNTAGVVSFQWSSADGTGDQLVLDGYDMAPARVLFDGVLAPPGAVVWNARSSKLELTLAPTGSAQVVRVEP